MKRRRPVAAAASVTTTATVAALLAVTSGAGAAPIRHTATPGCAPVAVVALAGTTETNPSANPDVAAGTFAAVTNPLKEKLGDNVRVRFPGYSASAFDKGLTYAESRKQGIEAAKNEITATARSCPNTKFILGGFSQGAHAIMDVAVDIGAGRGPIPPDKVLAVGTISDPGQGTPGETLVGPPVQGVGIAGPRTEGVGALKGRVATICRNQPVDLYCATNRAKDGFLASLGNMLGNSTSDGKDQASQLGSSLVSDFTGADLGTIPSSIATLNEQLGSPAGQWSATDVTAAASNVVTSLQPVNDLVQSLAGNPGATQALTSAPAGTPEALAGQAIDALSHIDLNGALNNAARILTTAQNALTTPGQPGAGGAPAATAPTGDLTDQAGQLSQQMQPLTGMPADALTTATSIMSTLRPATVVNQLLNAATGVTSFAANIPKILDDLFVQLPQKIIALDVPGAHQICGELNNLFQPLVKMAAAVDLGWIGQIVGMIPDPQNFAQIASMILGILGNVDVIRLANDVGALQEVAWHALEALTSGRPVDAGLALTGLLGPGLDIATVAFGAVSGGGQKTDPSQLGKLNPATQTAATGQTGPAALPGLAKQLTDTANSQGAQDLQQLVSQGIDAAVFYGTNAHNLYHDFVVDNSGRTAPQWMSDWFAQQAAKAGL
ncbi:cutinase family protein [Nocardia wallacei]|uniref:cutinase family protein n=1 Tax=Nocardia wallacei TaxID=480035 RepID=UPI0024546EF3|nr:cutinase family protein [Nocardia wallacei]